TVVLARQEGEGDKRLVAYVVPDTAALKAPHRQAFRDSRREVVAYRNTYSQAYAIPAARPSFMGWNSSYDGKAFPEEQMQEWLESTVRRIAVLAHPSKVLEIGCGPGLLLERLAPSCKVYRATEVSSEALGRLRSWITCRDDLSHVELEQSAPVDLSVSNPHGYDTVILNSIVRYFPDAEYLIDVLRKAAA